RPQSRWVAPSRKRRLSLIIYQKNKHMKTTHILTKNAKTTMKQPLSAVICTLLLLLSTAGGAAGQNVLAQIPILSSSGDGQVAANPALNLVYAAGGFTSGGTLT